MSWLTDTHPPTHTPPKPTLPIGARDKGERNKKGKKIAELDCAGCGAVNIVELDKYLNGYHYTCHQCTSKLLQLSHLPKNFIPDTQVKNQQIDYSDCYDEKRISLPGRQQDTHCSRCAVHIYPYEFRCFKCGLVMETPPGTKRPAQSWKGLDTNQGFDGYTSYKQCTHPPTKVVLHKTKEWEIWCGARYDLSKADLSSFDYVVNLCESSLCNIWKDNKFRGVYLNYTMPNNNILPHDVYVVAIQLIAKWIKDEKKVMIHCVGGHGRTGYVLAGVLHSLRPRIQDPLEWVWSNYCEEAIESMDQGKAILKLINRPLSKMTKATKEFLKPVKTSKIKPFTSVQKSTDDLAFKSTLKDGNSPLTKPKRTVWRGAQKEVLFTLPDNLCVSEVLDRLQVPPEKLDILELGGTETKYIPPELSTVDAYKVIVSLKSNLVLAVICSASEAADVLEDKDYHELFDEDVYEKLPSAFWASAYGTVSPKKHEESA